MNTHPPVQLKVALLEGNPIVRFGLEVLLRRLSRFKVQTISLLDSPHHDWLEMAKISMANLYILNPLYCGLHPRRELDFISEDTKLIALCYGGVDAAKLLREYDGVLHISDSFTQLTELVERLVHPAEEEDAQATDTLTPREREILVGVAKGLTNKEIAAQLRLSTHTVITHRRNLSKKLQIHSPSGLTIYAIMNKLVDIGEVNQKQ